jgi:predicted outer membrane lipoprotein
VKTDRHGVQTRLPLGASAPGVRLLMLAIGVLSLAQFAVTTALAMALTHNRTRTRETAHYLSRVSRMSIPGHQLSSRWLVRLGIVKWPPLRRVPP